MDQLYFEALNDLHTLKINSEGELESRGRSGKKTKVKNSEDDMKTTSSFHPENLPLVPKTPGQKTQTPWSTS